MNDRLGSIINYLVITILLIGTVGILGWLLNIPILYTFLSNGASMKFITALSTALIGLALFGVSKEKIIVTQLLASVVLLIGIATMAEYLLNIDLKVDITFAGSSATNFQVEVPGRMSLYTAILFILVSTGMLLFTAKRYFVGQCIVLLGVLMTYSALLGVLFNIGHLFTFGYFSSVTFPPAAGLLATFLSLLLYSADEGWVSEIFTRHSAAQTVRYAILYFFIGTPLFLGLFLLALKYTGYTPEFTLVILIIGTTACTLPLAYKLLKKMNRADKNLHQLTIKLKRHSQELVDKNDALSRINKDLDNIIHILSHDLKTPLTSLQASLDLLGLTLESTADDHQRNLLAVPKRSIKQLKAMIDYLGQIIKAQRSQHAILEELDVCALVEEIKTTVLQAAIKNTDAIINVHINDCSLFFERIHVYSILQNLLSNAIKYHFPGRKPVVNISSQKTQDGVQLMVEDNGLGIPEKEIPHLFTKFKRFHQHVEGTGIGLYLSKRLLEAHGGRIEVASKEGVGTTFKVFFPYGKKGNFYHRNSKNTLASRSGDKK